jgi:hypothetical protein
VRTPFSMSGSDGPENSTRGHGNADPFHGFVPVAPCLHRRADPAETTNTAKHANTADSACSTVIVLATRLVLSDDGSHLIVR